MIARAVFELRNIAGYSTTSLASPGRSMRQSRDRAQIRQLFDRLVGRPVLAVAHRIMREHQNRRQFHECGKAGSGTRIVAENEERRAEGRAAGTARDHSRWLPWRVLEEYKVQIFPPGVAGCTLPATPGGKNLHFGIREPAMAAIVNGLALSKLRAFGATLFIFSDYAHPAIRLSALMELPSRFCVHA